MQLVPASGSGAVTYPGGYNFLANKQLAAVFQKGREDAAKNGEPIICGPIHLADGRSLMLGISPVLSYDGKGKEFKNWGSSVILLRAPEAMAAESDCLVNDGIFDEYLKKWDEGYYHD